MALLKAPSGVVAGTTFKLPLTGNSYTVDTAGFVSATSQYDINALIAMGFEIAWGGRNNFIATTDPNVGSDQTADYQPGSLWLNTSAQRAWICLNAATGAAVWLQISTGGLIASAGSGSLVNLTLSGLLTHSIATGVTAFSGGGQGSATVLTDEINIITTAAASSAPYDSVKFGAEANGEAIWVINAAANPVQLFGNGSDTVNGFASSTGVTILPGDICRFIGDATGKWIGKILQYTTGCAYNTNSATSGTTLTGANLTGAPDVTLNMTGTMGGDANAQLPTCSNLFAAIPNAAAGQSYRLRVINSSSANHVWTLTTNTGWTLNGTMTIAQDTWRDFYVTLGSSTTATLQSIGTGTFS
jgi:hypothetical protein